MTIIETNCFLSKRQNVTHSFVIPRMPQCSSLAIKISCSAVSKAYYKSTKIPQPIFALFKFSQISSIRLIKHKKWNVNLNKCYEAWSYKKKKYKKIKAYKKSVYKESTVNRCLLILGVKATQIMAQRKAFYRQRIPGLSHMKKETLNIGILVT